MGADEALIADNGAVEHGRTHANENFVADSTGVKDRAVADGHVIAENAGELIGEMQDGVILDVGMVADGDAINVSARDGVIPNTGVIAHGHVAENHRAFGNIHPIAQRWLFAQKNLELLFQFHGVVVAKCGC